MSDIIARFRPTRHHTGTWLHHGNTYFFVAIGLAVVVLLIVFGIYEVAQNALRGVADVARAATP